MSVSLCARAGVEMGGGGGGGRGGAGGGGGRIFK